MVYGLIRFIIMVTVGTVIAITFALGVGFIVGTPVIWKWVVGVLIIVFGVIDRVVRQEEIKNGRNQNSS